MKICYFGIYNRDYSRNRIIIKGLKENRIEVIECHSSLSGIYKYWDLIKKYWAIDNTHDVIMVGFPGWQATILAKILTRKPIVFDAYLSFYNVMVFDRKICSPKGLKAKYYWFLDWFASRLADKILLDTNAHINYFVKTFKIKKEKFLRVLIGADDSIFYPLPATEETKHFLVIFHGYFIPVQGVEYIIRAAKILENHKDIQFQFIGTGQEYDRMVNLAKDLSLNNVVFLGRKPYQELTKYLSKMDVGLGNFGSSEKTLMVIANKSYEIIAMGKAHISADVPAMRELFRDRENILFCQRANPESLAEKILELKNNQELKKRIAQNGYRLYKNNATPKIIAKNLIDNLGGLIKK